MMTFTGIQRNALKLHAASAILTGHNTAWASLRAGLTKNYEPVFAAHLCASLSDLATPWRAELRQIAPHARLSISSVFTHQRPYVTFTIGASTQHCELADVMIALIDRTDPSNIQSRCIFVQAKRDDSSTVTLAQSNDLVQLHLYTNRPTFDVKRKAAPMSISFPGVTHGHDTALNYGITPPSDISTKLTPAFWGTDRWRIANNLNGHSSATISATVPLQDLLVDFLDGCTGFDFVLSSPGDSWIVLDNAGQKWSALINFILQDAVTARSPRYASQFWRHRSDGGQALAFTMLDSHGTPYVTVNVSPRSSAGQSPTYAMTLLDQLLTNSQSSGDPPHIDPPSDDGERDDGLWGGMSVVVMEMTSRND